MAQEILMPQLGLTMEEGTVTQWLKQEGQAVKAGEALLEITTDKLVSEVTSDIDGVLLKIIAQEGEDIPVKGLLGLVGQPGEQTAAAPAAPIPAQAPPSAPVPEKPPVSAPALQGRRIRISPLARKTAARLGVDYTGITGTGTSGRIIQKDILAQHQAAPKAQPVQAPAVPEKSEKLSSMRRTVAQRMLQSHTEIPSVTQVTKVDVTALMALRAQLLAQTGKKYSVNDLVLKAAAKALRSHPELLVSWAGDKVIRHDRVNLGMAVSLDAGLIVPVIPDADKLGLDALSAAAKDLALRARENKLTPGQYQGSTFTVSNMGMYAVESFTPIINQPNAAILGVCAIQDELQLEEDGRVAKHQVMRLCLTFDHRLLDGTDAAKFALTLRDLLQSPLGILL